MGDFLGTLSRLGQGFGPLYTEEFSSLVIYALPATCLMFLREWVAEYRRDIHFLHSPNMLIRLVTIALLISFIIYAGQLEGNSFIYFQF